jgi:multidrug efflux pump subunit AcrA (membrane-fusion protein)
MKKFISALLVAITLSGLFAPHPVFAHGEAIEVSGGGARGPVQLSAAQQAAIALKTAKAESRPLAALLNINGEAALLPDRQADITPRISGQVLELYVNLGDSVRAGQRLALVQGRLVGNVSVTISAPINGIIDARDAVVGQAVEPGTRLFHVSDRSQMIIVGKVYEESLGQVKLGQEARFRLLAYPDLTLIGKVTLIEPNLDPQSRTVRIWMQTDNPQNLLKPDMFARIGIVLRKNDSALSVPNNAIIEANGEKFVFVREGDKFNRVEVSIGAADDEYSEITDGLVPGDEVATQGNREIYTMWLTGGQMKSEDD